MLDIDHLSEVRLGVIGLGRLFREGYDRWLPRYLAREPNVRLVGVADNFEPAMRRFSQRYQCRGFTQAEDLIEQSGANAIVINTPPWTHRPFTTAAADRGIHVLCEKPMAPTVADCWEMIDACDRARVLLQVSFMRRFIPGMQYVRHAMRSGELGRVAEVRILWPYFIPDLDAPPVSTLLAFLKRAAGFDAVRRYGAWRLKDPRAGGGDFMDHGGHVLDLLRFWLGEPEKICGRSTVMVPGRNEDDTTCVATFAGGTMAIVTTTLHDHSKWAMANVQGYVRGEAGRSGSRSPRSTSSHRCDHCATTNCRPGRRVSCCSTSASSRAACGCPRRTTSPTSFDASRDSSGADR